MLESSDQDDIVRLWAAGIIGKHESKMSSRFKENEIITSGDVETNGVSPEGIDIRNIYPFRDMYWVIYHKHDCYHLKIMCKTTYLGHVRLCDIVFAHFSSKISQKFGK